MSLTEILIIVAGAAIGYWVVSLMMEKKRPARPESASESGSRSQDRSEPQPAGPRPWHDVLGVAPDASPAGIRTAYRSLMSQYHPDKVASLGPELRELAERKSREITQAYREVMSARGDEA